MEVIGDYDELLWPVRPNESVMVGLVQEPCHGDGLFVRHLLVTTFCSQMM